MRAWCLQNGIRENSYYYWLRIIREEALYEAENKSCALVRVEPEKLAVETVSPQSSSERIVIRTHGVEAEFPPGTDIGMLAALVKALSHEVIKQLKVIRFDYIIETMQQHHDT